MPNGNVVFVVDDDPGMLVSVKRLLRTNGYDSMLFSSAKAFRDQVDFEDACCVVLDINLEDGSGIELRHRLNDAGISAPVIYMTGNDNPAVREAALASGCIAFLTKPFAVQELIEPLKKAREGVYRLFASVIGTDDERTAPMTTTIAQRIADTGCAHVAEGDFGGVRHD